ncbi:amidohydrolase [Microlunatus sagamiharensis]|uniref:Amidohydrolase n=1 Tax=Microlunatus sagamiharensis TaxID=546874 RepID=A0A1H2LI09_9ACTN|nr:amidohydrolase [Microlunatus sagamiharensis]SDU80693.1 amidohydrolase [Microlunatus sagamiharensis]
MSAPVDDHLRRARIVAEVDDLHERLIAFRRDVHAHPEVGNAEHRTTAKVVEALESCGLVAKVLPIGTGAWCDVLPYGDAGDDGDSGAGLVGLRADLDALPIPDGSAVDFASKVPGVAHACGHDVHTTIVLGVGMVLARLREDGLLRRGVRLIFQPAEETSPGGAVDAIDGGVLTDVSEVYALHCDPRTDAGQIALKTGPVTSAVSQVSVILTGGGGHTSRPHLTQDVVAALGTLVTQTQLVFSRRVDPRSGVSMMWGRITAGSAPNAIPSSGQVLGTLRALTTDGWEQAMALLPEVITQIVAPFGVEARVTINEGTPPAVNTQSGVDRLTAAGEAMLGPVGVTATEQSLGGEDFSWMLQQVPGAMARLGVRTPGSASWPDIHHPSFRVDESCIDVGLKVLADVASTVPAPVGSPA